MLSEDFIPQKWLNSIFSELENYELVQNSVDEWFLWPECTLKKRAWLFTDVDVWWTYPRQTDAEIKGKIINWWVAYFWDADCNVYKFELVWNSYVMTKIYDNSALGLLTLFDVNMYGDRVKQKAVVLPYTSIFVSWWTADKVLSTNDDGSGNVVLAVNEAATFSAWSVGQYIYFTPQASAAAAYQIRQIVQFIDDQTVYLGEMFYADPSTWWVAEPWETYETIDSVVVFNNLRDSAGLVLCIDAQNDYATYRNLWWNDIELFEWRFWQISWYWTSVWWSFATWEYEILDPATVLWWWINARWQKMNSLITTKNYLAVNMESWISVVWQIWVNTSVTPIYNLTWIMNWDSALSPDSIFYKWWFYYLWKDRIFEGGDIVPTSTNIIGLQVKNQWVAIDKYISAIKDSDYVRCYDFWRWIIIQYTDWVTTRMLVYDSIYECWLPRIYNMPIYDKFEMFYWDLLIGVWDKICLKQKNIDLTEDISCKCVITWSKQIKNSVFSLKKIKLALGYFDNIIHNFKVTIDLWEAVFESSIQKDSMWVQYLVWQNLAANGSSLGSIPIWFNLLWWWNWEWWENMISTFIAKMGLIWIPIGKKCTYYKITFENLENYDLNIQWITVLLEQGNPYITPLQNVF